PPLTTIRQPMAELARTATEILIAGGDINHRRLPHTLVERASVAPPKGPSHE
ncbi:MAG: LacI family transcriptional regulator, partial [Alphaproteobacteria bacterium HGW-Alphaproteobacteria-15]